MKTETYQLIDQKYSEAYDHLELNENAKAIIKFKKTRLEYDLGNEDFLDFRLLILKKFSKRRKGLTYDDKQFINQELGDCYALFDDLVKAKYHLNKVKNPDYYEYKHRKEINKEWDTE